MASKKRMLLGIAAIFFLGSAVHFAFEWLGKSVFAAPFFAINESVWEHGKLLSTGVVLWMAADYFLTEKELRARYFSAQALALPVGLLLMPMIFYLLKSGFGIENLAVDITNFLVVAAAYEMIATILERRCGSLSKYNAAGAVFLGVIVLVYALLTFFPPRLPIFRDPPSGGYGIIPE